MDSQYHSLLIIILLPLLNFIILNRAHKTGGAAGVIKVNYKFAGAETSLSTLRAHDDVRHLAIFAGVDLPLGGTGRPDAVGLYYAKIGIGMPSKDYYVQVDTGSDITWVNCMQCHQCSQRGYHGIELTLYNPRESLTGKIVSCNQDFCKEIGGSRGCTSNSSCLYTEVYGDGSYSMGYFVEDVVHYDRVSGDLQTKSANGSVIFGCGAGQSGDLRQADDALDGILGFGKSNSSMLSQLASAGRVKKMFAHCLDGVNGGGIFAIGHVVQPLVNTTPLVPGQLHYNVNMTAVQVGHAFLNLTTDVYTIVNKKGVIIDSGTTLAYLAEAIYLPLVNQILSWQMDLKVKTLDDQYTCFDYSGSVDDGFPPVILHFENSLSLKVYPHEYLFPFEELMCIGWQNSGIKTQDKMNITVLGDLVLSNKLILYDLEKQAIGWTEYNCSSSIQLKDEITGSVHVVGSHILSHGSSFNVRATYLLLIALLHGLMMPLFL